MLLQGEVFEEISQLVQSALDGYKVHDHTTSLQEHYHIFPCLLQFPMLLEMPLTCHVVKQANFCRCASLHMGKLGAAKHTQCWALRTIKA